MLLVWLPTSLTRSKTCFPVQASQLLAGLGGFRDLNTPGAVAELRDGDGDAVPFPLKSDPLVPACDILEHKKRFKLWRRDMVVPEAEEGAGETLTTVPLFFEMDPEPGEDYGRAAPEAVAA